MRFSKTNDVLGTTNRGNAAESSLCTLCRADCKGRCETWLSSLVGRKLLYPRSFGMVTAGANNTTHVGVSYNSLRIQGYAYGSHGLSTTGEPIHDRRVQDNFLRNSQCIRTRSRPDFCPYGRRRYAGGYLERVSGTFSTRLD